MLQPIDYIILSIHKCIQLHNQVKQNKSKCEQLIRCLKAIEGPLNTINNAEYDQINISHKNTFEELNNVVINAKALLLRQTSKTYYIVKALTSMKVRDEFHAIQIDLQLHMEALNLSINVLSSINQINVKEYNKGFSNDLLKDIFNNQQIITDNQNEIMNNQNEMKNNQNEIKNNQNEIKNNQNEMKSNQNEMKSNQNEILSILKKKVSEQDYENEIMNTGWQDKPDNYKPEVTALHQCAKLKNEEEAVSLMRTFLLKKNLYIDHENNDGDTPLFVAVKHNADGIVKLLLEDFAVNFQIDANKKAWILIITNNKSNLVELFIKSGADVNSRTSITDFKSHTLLHEAICQGNLEIVKFLVNAGSELNMPIADGNFTEPLYAALSICASVKISGQANSSSGNTNENKLILKFLIEKWCGGTGAVVSMHNRWDKIKDNYVKKCIKYIEEYNYNMNDTSLDDYIDEKLKYDYIALDYYVKELQHMNVNLYPPKRNTMKRDITKEEVSDDEPSCLFMTLCCPLIVFMIVLDPIVKCIDSVCGGEKVHDHDSI